MIPSRLKFDTRTGTKVAAIGCAAALLSAPLPGLAQDNADARLRQAEAEIRALQRAVFPGGDGRFFEPQIAPGDPAPRQDTGAPSTTAVTDILARLDALEAQIQRATALTEETMNTVSGLSARLDGWEAREAARARNDGQYGSRDGAVDTDDDFGSDDFSRDDSAREDGSFQASVPPPGGTPRPRNDRIATNTNLSAMTGGASDEDDRSDREAEAARPGPSPERLAAVREITKPQTDDAADDEYTYGFRLWDAGFYPEARQQLASYVEEHSEHFRVTYGRNLLGRAFLDDGQPEQAARWFLRNYQADRTANRAPDSLLYLAEAMIAMDDESRACIALAEFGETYPAVATGRLADQYEANRRRVTCE